MSITVKKIVTSIMEENTYIIYDDKTGNCAVVDPGEYSDELENSIRELGIDELRYILLTHGHFDHIGGVKKLKENFGGRIAIHSEDEECLHDFRKNLSRFFAAQVDEAYGDIMLSDGGSLRFGSENIEIIHTPGHTDGGVCFKLRDMIFTGDTLFNLTVGRTDFPGGNYKVLLSSLKKLYDLEGDFKLYPGHEGESTLNFERKNNSFMKGCRNESDY